MRSCFKRQRRVPGAGGGGGGDEESVFNEREHGFHLERWEKVWKQMVATARAPCECL